MWLLNPHFRTCKCLSMLASLLEVLPDTRQYNKLGEGEERISECTSVGKSVGKGGEREREGKKGGKEGR